MGKLDFYLHPQSIAVIGASAVEGKVGHAVMRNIIKSGYTGKLYPINPKPGTILGFESYKSVKDVEGPIDVCVICIPAAIVNKAVIECGEKGVKGIIIVSAGFREIGGHGIELEQGLVDIIHKYNVRCVGPNVLGNITTAANMSFSAKTPKKGKVAMLSQSGAMMTAVLDWADTQKIGFSHFISLGNKCDVDEVDFIEEISEDPDTAILILYLESVTNGSKFLEVVSKATIKKPVVILKSGISPAGKAAASSHTGALAGDDIAFDIAFERCGVIRVKTMKELFDLSNLFDKVTIMPKGDYFSILTNAGGPGIIATDAFEKYGLKFAAFNETTTARLREHLPPEASVKNPVDIVGDARPLRFQQALEAIFEEESPENCAGTVVLVTPQSTTDPTAVADVLVNVHKKFPDRLMLTTFIGGETMVAPRQIVETHGITSYQFPEPAIHSLHDLLRYKHYIDRCNATSEAVQSTMKCGSPAEVNDVLVDEIIGKAQKEGRQMLLPNETVQICEIYDLPCPHSSLATKKEDLKGICDKIGFPIVLKIASPDIQHKSDIGGVKLKINTVEEAERAYDEIMDNVNKLGPKNAKIFGIEVQKESLSSNSSSSLLEISTENLSNMPTKVTEVILGMTRDPQWGPMLMVGAGGIYANYIKDVAFELAFEYSQDLALAQLKRTKIYQILQGVRGEKRSDIEQLTLTMVKMAQLARNHPNMKEIDMNPLCVRAEGEGILALDIKFMV